MRKVPTLFLRDENDRRYVTRQVNPVAQWVLDGEGVATRKYDGTCMKLDDAGEWWARREVKPGKSAPANYVAEETDPVTGKTVGWEPVKQSPFVKAWREVMNNFAIDKDDLEPGTYELCGPKVNGNPEGYAQHVVIPHADALEFDDVPRDFDGLAKFMQDLPHEGIVWHWAQPDGEVLMAKLKRRDVPPS